MIDHQQHPAGLEIVVEALRHRGSKAGGRCLEVEVVPVLHGDDRVERLGEFHHAERIAKRGDIGVSGHRGLLLVGIGRLVLDEFGGLIGIDPPLVADRFGEDAREIAATHDEVGDLVARFDAREGEKLARMARGIAFLVSRGASGIGERGADRRGDGLGVCCKRGGEREQCDGNGELHGNSPAVSCRVMAPITPPVTPALGRGPLRQHAKSSSLLPFRRGTVDPGTRPG